MNSSWRLYAFHGFWVSFSARMDTSLKVRILKDSYFLKLNKSTLKSEKGILILNHEHNDNNMELGDIFFS